MEATMTPRDIQLRIRSGESLADVIAASGLPAARVEGFATPILAEREHITATALSAAVRRNGEAASARRLRQTVAESMLSMGQDVDFVTWDSWRRSDGRWILQGTWNHGGNPREARFLFDPKGRFSVADNDQARVLIGDLPITAPVDLQTETTERIESRPSMAQSDLGNEPTMGLSQGQREDSLRNDIDMLYDMISTTDEDSVRIFRGLRNPINDLGSGEQATLMGDSVLGMQPWNEFPEPDSFLNEPSIITLGEPAQPDIDPSTPSTPTTPPEPPAAKPRKKRKRAEVPAWDDIIFGGQS